MNFTKSALHNVITATLVSVTYLAPHSITDQFCPLCQSEFHAHPSIDRNAEPASIHGTNKQQYFGEWSVHFD